MRVLSVKKWWKTELKGGEGSGNFGHGGRPGEVGGSGEGGGKEWEDKLKELGVIKNDKNSSLNFEGFKTSEEQNKVCSLISNTHMAIVNSFPNIKEVLDKNPVRYLVLINDKNLSIENDEDELYKRAVGLYDPDFDKLIVSRGVIDKEWVDNKPKIGSFVADNGSLGVYRHELGHHVFDKLEKFTGARAAFNDIYNNLNESQIKKGISIYASTNNQEGFAEAFSAYTNPKYGEGKCLDSKIENFFIKYFPKSELEKKFFGLSTIFKGGPGSGNWEGPGDPRFAFEGSSDTKVVDGIRVMPDGSPLPDHLVNIRIPPAWTNVNVSKDPNSGLLVKGQDSKGRSQSIYSEKFMKQNADAKFSRVMEMNRKFDSIQKENERNLLKSKDPEIKESAAALSVIMATGIRPGSEQDTGAEKQAYGATTLEGRHVKIDGNEVRLEFTGKKGVDLSIPVTDSKVAAMITDRASKVGTNGKLFNVDHGKLLSYTKSLDGGGFNIKDFRTLLGTKTAVEKIKEYGDKKPSTMKEFKKMVKDVAISVSKKLGNTPTIALQSYVNPIVFKQWQLS